MFGIKEKTTDEQIRHIPVSETNGGDSNSMGFEMIEKMSRVSPLKGVEGAKIRISNSVNMEKKKGNINIYLSNDLMKLIDAEPGGDLAFMKDKNGDWYLGKAKDNSTGYRISLEDGGICKISVANTALKSYFVSGEICIVSTEIIRFNGVDFHKIVTNRSK